MKWGAFPLYYKEVVLRKNGAKLFLQHLYAYENWFNQITVNAQLHKVTSRVASLARRVLLPAPSCFATAPPRLPPRSC